MNKIKNIIAIAIFAVLIYACGDDNTAVNPFANINHKALALSDNDSLVKFLQNHYYDTDIDSVKALVSGKTPMYNDIIEVDALRNDIKYILYVYKTREGNPIDPNFGQPSDDKGNPSISDSIFAKYSGQTILSTTDLSGSFDNNTSGAWFTYNTLAVRGWSYGFTKLKGGYLEKDVNGGVLNGPINYLEGGKGIIFIPSGLAYTSIDTRNYSASLVNKNLMFYIELLDFVKDTDHDNDGKPSDEEDANNDGDLSNDFSDPNNPTLPDYLNPDIK